MNLPTFILAVLILAAVIRIFYRQFQTKGHCDHCESECAVKHHRKLNENS